MPNQKKLSFLSRGFFLLCVMGLIGSVLAYYAAINLHASIYPDQVAEGTQGNRI